MLKSMNLQEMANELHRIRLTANDYIAPASKISMDNDGKLVLGDDNMVADRFSLLRNAERQMSQYTKIPQAYYDVMPAELKAQNVNHWLSTMPPNSQRMIRTVDGHVRGMMSDSYRIIDNYDLAEAVLPVLNERSDLVIDSAHVGEDRFFLKALFPKTEMEVGVGDAVQAGVVISNSEVGNGAVKVEPLVYRLVCSNGMISASAMRKFHVGSKADQNEEHRRLLREETKTAKDKAFFLEVADIVRGSMEMAVFEKEVRAMAETKNWKIEGDVVESVQRIGKKLGLNESDNQGVLGHLIEGGSLNGFGMLNAITRHAQDVDSYERSVDLERAGGKITQMSAREWNQLTAA